MQAVVEKKARKGRALLTSEHFKNYKIRKKLQDSSPLQYNWEIFLSIEIVNKNLEYQIYVQYLAVKPFLFFLSVKKWKPVWHTETAVKQWQLTSKNIKKILILGLPASVAVFRNGIIIREHHSRCSTFWFLG